MMSTTTVFIAPQKSNLNSSKPLQIHSPEGLDRVVNDRNKSIQNLPRVNKSLENFSISKNRIKKEANCSGKLLTPLERFELEKSLQTELQKKYRQRIEIMLLADQGKTQIEIKKAIGCCQDTVRRWVLMARAGMALNWQETPIGRPKTVDDRYLNRLKELVTQNPREFGYCFERWTANCLRKHLIKELDIEVSERHINRLLKKMGLSTKPKKSAIDSKNSCNSEESNKKISFKIDDL